MKRLVNTLLVLFSVILSLVMLDVFIFPRLIQNLPLDKHAYLDPPLRVLAQSSKKDLVPADDYIAVCGDSYAQGKGDWLTKADASKNSPYQATHVMRKMLDRDVISLAKAGAGSLRAIAGYPFRNMDYLQRMFMYDIPEPKTVIIYFYSGNDLLDNISSYRRFYTEKGYSEEKTFDSQYYQSFLEEFSEDYKTYMPVVNLTSAIFIGNAVKSYYNSFHPDVVPVLDVLPECNTVLIGGEEVHVDKGFQFHGPAYEKEQVDLAMYVFGQSLAFIKKKLPDTSFLVVYIPSVPECYEFKSTCYYNQDGQKPLPVSGIAPLANRLREDVESMAHDNDMAFTDMTGIFRAAARKEFIHGSQDFYHLNEKGYRLLAEALVDSLKANGLVR